MKLTDTIDKEYANVESQEKKVVYKQTEGVNKIIPLYENWLTYMNTDEEAVTYPDDFGYPSALERVKTLTEFTQDDIAEMMIRLIGYQDDFRFGDSGLFISALINFDYQRTKRKEPYTLITEHLPDIHYLCSELCGQSIFIRGSTGDCALYKMHSGNVTITGNIGYNSCIQMNGGTVLIQKNSEGELGNNLDGGTIVVEGDALEANFTHSFLRMKSGTAHIKGNAINIGRSMKGGNIIIEGNVEKRLGDDMRGGEIIVYGNAAHIGSRMTNGKITVHKNILSIGNSALYDPSDKESPLGGEIYQKERRVFPPIDESPLTFLNRLWKKTFGRHA